jgi:hypothetical protein
LIILIIAGISTAQNRVLFSWVWPQLFLKEIPSLWREETKITEKLLQSRESKFAIYGYHGDLNPWCSFIIVVVLFQDLVETRTFSRNNLSTKHSKAFYIFLKSWHLYISSIQFAPPTCVSLFCSCLSRLLKK